jgi:hypothetical protein
MKKPDEWFARQAFWGWIPLTGQKIEQLSQPPLVSLIFS